MQRLPEPLERILQTADPMDDLFPKVVRHLKRPRLSEAQMRLLDERLAAVPDELRLIPTQWLKPFKVDDMRLLIMRRLKARRGSRQKQPWFDDYALGRVSASPMVVSIQQMKLFWCSLTDEGARSLAGSPYFKSLRALSLVHNNISGVGVEALLASGRLPCLDELRLSRNPIRDEGARRIMKSRHVGRLRLLEVRDCGISEELARELRIAGQAVGCAITV